MFYFFSPENVRARKDIFYLQPEKTSGPDDVCFSTSGLNQHQIDKMLQRVLMVREVQEHILTDQVSSEAISAKKIPSLLDFQAPGPSPLMDIGVPRPPQLNNSFAALPPKKRRKMQ